MILGEGRLAGVTAGGAEEDGQTLISLDVGQCSQ